MGIKKIESVLERLPTVIQSNYKLDCDYQWQPPELSKESLACLIDHTYLKIDANSDKIISLCDEAKRFSFYSVCIHPVFLTLVRKNLEESAVKIASVCNFPLGSMLLSQQVEEVKTVAELSDEIDYVAPFSLIKEESHTALFEHLKKIKAASGKKPLKIILETSDLSEDEIIRTAIISVAAKVNFLKTSTGFAKGGATPEVVGLLRAIASDQCSVKASGGIRNYQDALSMVKAGANRLGCSAGVSIVSGKKSEGDY